MPLKRRRRDGTSSCVELYARREVCYVMLARGRYHHSRALGDSARGDSVIADYDREGHLLGIELIGPGKRCQSSIAFSDTIALDEARLTLVTGARRTRRVTGTP